MKASPRPAPRRGDQPRHERQRGRQDRGDADPLEDPGGEEGPDGTARLDPGERQDHAADDVRQPAGGECTDPADPVDDDARQEGRRDLDEGRRPDDQPDLRIGDAGLRERDRQRRGERMEAGLDGEDGEGETEHPRIIAERSPAERSPAPAVRARGRVGGSAGPAGARRARPTLAAAAAPPCIRGCTATYLRLHAPPPVDGPGVGRV